MCLFKTYSPAFSTLFFCPRKLVFMGTVLMTHIALVIKKLPCFLASRFIFSKGEPPQEIRKRKSSTFLAFVP